MSASNGNSTGIDKQSLYGDFRNRLKWQDILYKRAAYKALDIPEDDMQINNSKSGIGALGAIGIALAAGLPGLGMAGMLGYALLGNKPVPPVPGADKIVEKVITETTDVRAGETIVVKPEE